MISKWLTACVKAEIQFLDDLQFLCVKAVSWDRSMPSWIYWLKKNK